MRFLVCTSASAGQCCKLRVLRANDRIAEPFKVWAMNDGRRILFVERDLGRMLSKHHIGGNFESGAMYGLPPHEMAMILETKMGEDDRTRYLRLKTEAEVRKKELDAKVAASKFPLLKLSSIISWGVLQLLMTVVWHSIKLIVFLVVFPIIIGIIRSQKR